MSKLLSVFFAFVHILWSYFDFCINGIHLLLIFAAVGYIVGPSGGCLKKSQALGQKFGVDFFQKVNAILEKVALQIIQNDAARPKDGSKDLFCPLVSHVCVGQHHGEALQGDDERQEGIGVVGQPAHQQEAAAADGGHHQQRGGTLLQAPKPLHRQ